MQSQPKQAAADVLSLIGYRCSGKTTVGRLVADRLGWDFADADEQVRQLAGKEIAEIFADEGEPVFRDWETAAIAELVQRSPLVLSVGGGAVMRPVNRTAMAQAGPVGWLMASEEEIVRRLESDPTTLKQRPSLTAKSAREEVAEVLAVRRPVYEACATFKIDTEGKTPAEVADEIHQWVTRTREPDQPC